MRLIPRRRSRKQQALLAAGKVGRKAAKAKAVQKAPKTAAAVWAGKRSGKVAKAAVLALVGAITLKTIRSKRQRSHATPST